MDDARQQANSSIKSLSLSLGQALSETNVLILEAQKF